MPLTAGKIEIRDFHSGDFETLWRIDQACFPPGISYSKAELKAYMRRPGSFTLVATRPPDTPEIAGFIVAEAQKSTGHIITIDVLASGRRNGVGSRLLAAAEDRLQKDLCRQVELETAVDNSAALLFYKCHGYHVVGTIPHYYSNSVDALVLEKHFQSQVVGKK